MPWQFGTKTPIHQQIASRIRAGILNGTYPPDKQLPPVRQLAMEAGVNPNTVQRALTELESEGLFETRGTVGRFITSDREALERARQEMTRETLEKLVSDAMALGLTREDLIRYLSDTEKGGTERSDTDK